MGNKNSALQAKNRRPSLVRENSVFSEASWDFCNDADNVDSIELQILAPFSDGGRQTYHCREECPCDDCHERAQFGLYVMSDMQYRNWCKMFRRTLSNEMYEGKHEKKVWKIVEIFTRNSWLRRLFVRKARPCLARSQSPSACHGCANLNGGRDGHYSSSHSHEGSSEDEEDTNTATKRRHAFESRHRTDNTGEDFPQSTNDTEFDSGSSLTSRGSWNIPGTSPARVSTSGKSPLSSECSPRQGSGFVKSPPRGSYQGKSPTGDCGKSPQQKPRSRHSSGSDASSQDHTANVSANTSTRRRRCYSEPATGLHKDKKKSSSTPEDDLEAELQWLTAVTDSLHASGSDADLEVSGGAMSDCDDLSGSYESCSSDGIERSIDGHLEEIGHGRTMRRNLEDIDEGNDEGSNGSALSDEAISVSLEESWEPTPFDLETELEFLCEPEWNNLELELFWHVLCPHLEQLLQPQHAALLPDPCLAVVNMDAGDCKQLDRCLLHVQWHIWKGSYSQAVSDFRAVRRHFRCGAQSQLIESGTRDDMESLRLVFQRKRPSRFRLWI